MPKENGNETAPSPMATEAEKILDTIEEGNLPSDSSPDIYCFPVLPPSSLTTGTTMMMADVARQVRELEKEVDAEEEQVKGESGESPQLFESAPREDKPRLPDPCERRYDGEIDMVYTDSDP